MAAKEKTSSRWTAWLAPILLLLAAVAAAPPASALTVRATETRAWEKTSAPLESRLDESLQLLNLHQQNGGAGYDDALGSPLAAEGAATEQHHLLPRQFGDKFKAQGLDPEDFKIPLPKDQHRLLPDGIHTGPYGDSWNGQWDNFFKQTPNASQQQILDQLAKMRQAFGI